MLRRDGSIRRSGEEKSGMEAKFFEGPLMILGGEDAEDIKLESIDVDGL